MSAVLLEMKNEKILIVKTRIKIIVLISILISNHYCPISVNFTFISILILVIISHPPHPHSHCQFVTLIVILIIISIIIVVIVLDDSNNITYPPTFKT